MYKIRTKYFCIFVLMVLLEIYIALYVRDRFIRPYLGDVLVVLVLYAGFRVIFPQKIKLLPIYIFIFAVFIELLQLINIVNILGVEDNRFLRILIGSVFDIHDIVCYGVGCLILMIYEYGFRKDKLDMTTLKIK